MKMKILFFTVSLLLGTTVFSSAKAENVRGNGNIVTKEFQVTDYSSLRIGPGIECNTRFFDKKTYRNPVVNYEQNSSNVSFSITTDENVIPLLEISSRNNELTIGVKRGNKLNPSRFEVQTNSTKLENVTVSGCIDLIVNDKFVSDRLEVKISGASDVKFNATTNITNLKIQISGAGDFLSDDLTCGFIESSVSGAGDITLKGKADKANFMVSGAGDIKAYDFLVENLDCKVSGAGDIKVTATTTLNATVSGTGDIHYKGNAKATTRVSGFGDIKKVD